MVNSRIFRKGKCMKTVLISGGSSGLGKAIARSLVSNFNVVIFADDEKATQLAAEELGCDYMVGDVRNDAAMQRIVDETVEKYGQLDVLINNAGVFREGELDSHSPEEIKDVLDINTLGVMYLTRAAVPVMKRQKAGRIINIISQGGLYTKPQRSLYAASKWAITGFTRCLQDELAPYGIGVTGVYPGKLNTPIFETAGIYGRDMSDALEPEEVAKTIAFMLSFDNYVAFPEIGIKDLAQ